MTASPAVAILPALQFSSSNFNSLFFAPFRSPSFLRLNSTRRPLAEFLGQKSNSKAGECHKIRVAKVYARRAEEKLVIQEEAPQMLDTFPSFEVSLGLAHPLGVSQIESGINFAIFSQHASAVTLCIILPKRCRRQNSGILLIDLTLMDFLDATSHLQVVPFLNSSLEQL
ncbi:Isoamylase 3, chloroplastic [Datura stramonium]|uniref:Isoamylase 3, chloroplastic n=1 Tax=Datura stramonium TaxID=4076 RepID=A0ABS8V9F8_DATST|nr:Isoamylase 3, chloroplastic [Datura stramonium]